MSAARALSPVPPPSRRARPPHLPPSFAPVPPVRGHPAIRPVTRLRSPAPLPSCSARHPYLRRPLSRVCDPQHVPARPPLHLLAVPVTRTCTVLLAVSATLSTCPSARPPSSSPCLSHARTPISRRVCSMRPPVSTTWPCLHAPVNLAVADTCAALASLPLACTRRPTDRTAPMCRLSPVYCQPAPPIPGACATW